MKKHFFPLLIFVALILGVLHFSRQIPQNVPNDDVSGISEPMGFIEASSTIYLPNILGVRNPDVTQNNLQKTICNPSFRTGSIRPPTSYTNKIKKQKLAERNLADSDASQFELDHLISITDGGDPKDSNNLWIEPWHFNLNGYDVGAKAKDALEVRIHKLICNNTLTLKEGQDALTGDWTIGYKKYIGELPKFSTSTPETPTED